MSHRIGSLIGLGVVLVAVVVLSLAEQSAGQEGVVLAVRPEGVVVDLGTIDLVQRGTRLGFVHDDGERHETGQGVVADVREGKALVRLSPQGVAGENDVVVLCPSPGQDDRFAQLRAALTEPRGPAASPVLAQLQSALGKRDAAIRQGACYTGDLDREIATLADQLDTGASRAGSSDEDARTARPSPPIDRPAPDSTTPGPPAAGTPPQAAGGTPADTATVLVDAIAKLADSLGRKKERSPRASSGSDATTTPAAPALPTDSTVAGPLAPSPPPADEPPATSPARAPSTPAPSQTGRATGATSSAGRVSSMPTAAEQSAGRGAAESPSLPGEPSPWWQPPVKKGSDPKPSPATTQGRSPVVGSNAPGPSGQWWEAKTAAPTKGLLTLTGRVVDQNGRPVAGATVTIGEASTEVNSHGAFKLENVKPGQRQIQVTAAGFRAESRTLSVRQGAIEAVTFTLRRADAPSPVRDPSTVKRTAPKKFGDDQDGPSSGKDQFGKDQ